MQPIDSSSVVKGKDWKTQVIMVNGGENLAEVIASFFEQSGRIGCIISAIGTVSRVAFCREDTVITVTYEGSFEIVNFSGHYTYTESNNQSSGMVVSLSSLDNKLIGGKVNGILIAGSPVQVTLATFLTASDEDIERVEA